MRGVKGEAWEFKDACLERKQTPSQSLFINCLIKNAQAYLGGASVCSRNSSILMKSVLSVPLYSRKGGLVPGARSLSSSGFLEMIQKDEGAVVSCDLVIN